MGQELFSSKSYTSVNDLYISHIGEKYGNITLGNNTSKILVEDPKLLGFTLSRYKFVMKMLKGANSVLEIGCQEGFGANVIIPEVETYVGIDFYKPYIDYLDANSFRKNASFVAHDMLDGPLFRNSEGEKFESAFAIDVLEHILPESEVLFMENVIKSLDGNLGKFIVGMPTLESQVYASESSKIGHVNCKKAEDLKIFMGKFFKFTFVFSMNDEVLHTGFYPMSHYVFVIGAGPRGMSL